MAQKYGMHQTVCVICHQPTLFRFNEKKNNMPRTCGMRECMEKAGEMKPDAPPQQT